MKGFCFALIVQAPSSRSSVALEFARSALAAGHSIPRIFFLRQGSEIAREGAAATGWSQLAAAHGVELSVCVSGATRRDLYDASSGQAQGKQRNIADGFTIAGLGLMVDAIANADRVVTFL